MIEQKPGTLSEQQMKAARAAMESLKFHPRDTLPNRTALERAEALYMEPTGGARQTLSHRMIAFRAASRNSRRLTSRLDNSTPWCNA